MGTRSFKSPPPIVFILLGCLLWFGAKNFSNFLIKQESLPAITQIKQLITEEKIEL